MPQIGPDHLRSMFDEMERGAFRLETRQSYGLSVELETFKSFSSGDETDLPITEPWYRLWLDRVERVVASGRHIDRVRIEDEPPSAYQRFSRWLGQGNTAAGEEIRYLSRDSAVRAGLATDEDWWLFDDARVVVLQFDERGDVVGRELIQDLPAVRHYLEQREIAGMLVNRVVG